MFKSIKSISIVYLFFGIAILGYSVNLLTNCSSSTSSVDLPMAQQYLGDQTCKNCHEQEFQSWRDSHHDLAMQEVSDKTVLGDFNNITFTSNEVTSKFFKKDGKFYVNTEGGEGTFQDFEIQYTFGVEPLQQYLIAFPGGRLQTLLIAWDTKEQKWFDLMPAERLKTDDWLHWTKGSMTWNTMCADCHSTYLEKNYDETTDSYDTKWAIIDVSCEACHGPGTKHLEYVNSGPFKNGQKVKDSFLSLTSSLNNKEQVEECGRCHARRGPQTNVFDHTGNLMDNYLTETLRPGLYHADGQILDEVYVYGSFTQSKMYHNNVYCTSCHDPHSLKLKFDGNALCTQCHESNKYDVEEHHFHKIDTEGAACINCHMPGKFYMVNDFRRDHSFRIPRPDMSVQYDTPNACNQCHDDKNAEWAADAVNTWYGPRRRPHFSPALAAAQTGNLYALPSLINMVGDTSVPAIAQATALNVLSEVRTQETNQKVITSIKSSNPLIRYSAMNALEYFSAEDRLRYISPLLKDSILAIRTNAIYILADVDESLYQGELNEAFQKAKIEFQNLLKVQADFPAGQVMRGQYYQKTGDKEKAEIAYLDAIRQDPYLPQPYFNLANLYYSNGNLQGAKEQFEKVIELDPNAGDTYYSLGLLLAEMEDLEGSEVNLGKAAKLTGDPNHYYNWALTLQNLDRPKETENAYKIALQINPDSERFLYALAIFYIQQSRKQEAQAVVMKLLQINPQNKDYQNLLRGTR